MTETILLKREKYVDVVAGFFIALMIYQHCIHFSHFHEPVSYYLIGFFMPFFFYKSGMFFTPKQQSTLMKKDANKLLRSFVVYSFIGWVVWCACGLINESLLVKDCIVRPIRSFFHHGSVVGNEALWFLLTLFIVRQCANVMLKKMPPLVLSAICFLPAFTLYVLGWYRYSWWFGNIFSGMCFFGLGYWLKGKNNTILIMLSIVFLSFVVFANSAGWIHGFPRLSMHQNKMLCGNYLLFYPTALAGIIVINGIFRYLCKFIRFRMLEYIGVNAMNFYVTHWILFVFVVFVVKKFFIIDSPVIIYVILLGASILILPIINESLNTLKTKKIFQNIL